MKWKTSLFLFSLSLLMLGSMSSLKAQALAVVLQKQFYVPGSNQQQVGQAGSGVNMSFTLTQTSNVFLNLTSNTPSATINVTVLNPDDYALYKATGSLAKTKPIADLSKTGTGSYNSQGVLKTGTYGVVIQSIQSEMYETQPNVILEVDAIKYVPVTPTVDAKP
jgi:hypothetical protein